MRYLALVLVLLLSGMGAWFAFRETGDEGQVGEPPSADFFFEDVARQAGLDFRHFDPATERHLIHETMGSGLGWIDYDNDGWPDLFCVQGGPLPPGSDPTKTHKLYRNNGNGTFADVTDAVGLNRSGFGSGCAVGDYDNDGFDDLVVTSLGGLTLFHNEAAAAPGGRRFRDVTSASGLADPHWATSCAWGDLDGDGRLDLFVCNYVEIDPAKPVLCKNDKLGLYFPCSPLLYPHAHQLLFRNEGNGRFTDVSESSGIAAFKSPGLGVLIQDLDGDGKPEIYVANDMADALLFHNLGGMKFKQCAAPAGVALGPGAARMAGMGVAAADFDGSGRPSLFVSNFQGLPNALFLNRGKLLFADASHRSGLGGPSLSKLGFGTCAIDANLDGNLDLAVANGHVQRSALKGIGVQYAQECQLFLGDGGGLFRDVSSAAGADYRKPRVGRGLAAADFDNDGRPDLALSGVGEPVVLFRNRSNTARGWLALQLVGDGKASNRNAIGAVVEADYGGHTHSFFISGGGSYLSASDRRFLLGLGSADKIVRVSVRWPSGLVQEFRDLPANCCWKLIEGQERPERLN